MDRPTNRERADALLIEWYRWSKPWRPKLGAPRISPTCVGYVKDEKHNDESDNYEGLHRAEMETVEFCVDCLDFEMRKAIGIEMRNREVNARVWRSSSSGTFARALDAIVPIMRRKGLIG